LPGDYVPSNVRMINKQYYSEGKNKVLIGDQLIPEASSFKYLGIIHAVI